MEINKNTEKNQKETPGEEEVTSSMEEYSMMKKRLHEPGGMDSSMQSWEKESLWVVLETPHLHILNTVIVIVMH